MKIHHRITATAGLLVWLSAAALAQTGSLRDHVAAVKESLAESRQNLKHYQWTQTMVVLYKGEEKSRKVYLAKYGPDGTVQKTEVSASPEKQVGGLRGHIIKKKKEEMTEDMKRAVEMVKEYVPPDPARLQASLNSGNASVDIMDPGQKLRLNFRDYQMPGDILSMDFNPATHRPLGANVSTYMDDPKNPVGLVIDFGTLPDGTTYPSETTLDLKSKGLTVVVTNSNYTKLTE